MPQLTRLRASISDGVQIKVQNTVSSEKPLFILSDKHLFHSSKHPSLSNYQSPIYNRRAWGI